MKQIDQSFRVLEEQNESITLGTNNNKIRLYNSFIQEPPSKSLKNKRSAYNNVELVCIGCVIEVADIPFVVNPLTVSISEKRQQRSDMQHMNSYQKKSNLKRLNEAKQHVRKSKPLMVFKCSECRRKVLCSHTVFYITISILANRLLSIISLKEFTLNHGLSRGKCVYSSY